LNWQGLDQWQQWALGIGGSLLAACFSWFCKRLFGTRKKTDQGITIQQNASPTVTQTFQPTIHIHPTVAVPGQDTDTALREFVGRSEKEADSHLHKLRTESEFQNVQELWRRIVALKNSFWDIPKAGGFSGQQPGARESAAFVKCYDDTARFLNEEILCIPQKIVEETRGLLDVAFDEALKAQHYPDPFDGSVSALLGEKGWSDFVDSRSSSLRTFNLGAEELLNTMRMFLEGSTGTANTAGNRENSPPSIVPEDGMLWRITNETRTGPYCPTCFEDEGKTISLAQGATRGTYFCPIHGTSFWSAQFRKRFATSL